MTLLTHWIQKSNSVPVYSKRNFWTNGLVSVLITSIVVLINTTMASITVLIVIRPIVMCASKVQVFAHRVWKLTATTLTMIRVIARSQRLSGFRKPTVAKTLSLRRLVHITLEIISGQIVQRIALLVKLIYTISQARALLVN